MNGLWWKALVRVNGRDVGEATGGVFPASIDIANHLRVGTNTVTINATPPTDEPPILIGGERGEVRPIGVSDRVVLELMGGAHVESAIFPLSAGLVSPRAVVRGAPEGSRVRFFASRDGEVVRELGEAAVETVSGAASGPQVQWYRGRWGLESGGNSLYLFAAELLGPDRERLDLKIERAGLREVEIHQERLHINGNSEELVAVRTEAAWRSLEEGTGGLISAGINSLELHGVPLKDEWLDHADELGIPLLVVPRCDGNVQADERTITPLLNDLREQDRRLLRANSHHPSILMWSAEGSHGARRLLSTNYQADSISRPITGIDLPTRSIAMARQRRDSPERPTPGEWILEVTTGPQHGPEAAVQALGAAMNAGAIGGVLPLPRRDLRGGWLTAVEELTEEHTHINESDRRSSSRLTVTGLEPGAVAWLSAPLAPIVGAVANTSGEASILAWHEGAATLQVAGESREVTLHAGSWREGRLVQSPTVEVWQ